LRGAWRATGHPRVTPRRAGRARPTIASELPLKQGGTTKHPSLDRMRIGVDRGDARGNKTLCFSAFAPPIARGRVPPGRAVAPHTPTRRFGAREQLAESVGTAPLQLGRRQPCRPPPHTRAGMPSRGGSPPLQATGVAGAQVRGRPKLPTPSACTDGSPYRFRVCAVSRACKVDTEQNFGRFGRFGLELAQVPGMGRPKRSKKQKAASMAAGPTIQKQPSAAAAAAASAAKKPRFCNGDRIGVTSIDRGPVEVYHWATQRGGRHR
jgi:hypothetical protein